MAEKNKQKHWELLETWENMQMLLADVDNYPFHFSTLMEIALADDHKHSWRAAWIADKIHDKLPELFLPYREKIIEKLNTGLSQGSKRHFLKLLSLNEIPEQHYSFLLDFCIETLTSAKDPPAIRVHAMQILYNISELESDFKPELLAIIEHELEYHSTAGISSRGSKIVKKLRKQIEKTGY